IERQNLRDQEKALTGREGPGGDLARERELIGRCKKEAQSDTPEALNLFLALGRGQRRMRPELFKKIQGEARALLAGAAEFSGYRVFKAAYREARGRRKAAGGAGREA
ncbi:MAG: hypothetical protein LBH26_07375, partial [Treponema sp.]|nr:hypothetical protein [Treponema sp.]